MVRLVSSVLYSGNLATFLKSGGNFGGLNINFRAPNYCAVSWVISGVLDGTSTRKSLSGRGNTFIIRESGEILIHSAETY
jgi:hypothetical protein